MRALMMLLTAAVMAAFVASPGIAATKNKHNKAPAAHAQTVKPQNKDQTDPDPRVNCEIKRDPANCR